MSDPFSSLTAQQRLYAELAAIYPYADAYRTAYQCEGWSTFNIGREAHRLNNHPLISQYMLHLSNETAGKFSVTRDYLVRWHWLRLIYDPAELTRIVVGACRFCHGDGHQYHWRAQEFLDATKKAEATTQPMPDIAGGLGYNHLAPPHPACPNCGGAGQTHTWFADTMELSEAGRAAFEGVKVTRNGIEVMMADKNKAAEALAKLLGWDVVTVKAFVDFPSPEVMAAMTVDEISQAYKKLTSAG